MGSLFTHLMNHILSLIFPQTDTERYVTALLQGTATLPRASIQLVGPGVSCFSYKNKIIRDLLWQLKYRGDIRIAKIFGQALAHHLATYLAQTTIPAPYIVTSIPLSRRRQWWRGYNQADKIAHALTTTTHPKYEYAPRLLVRIKHRTPQAQIKNPVARLFNARGLFAVTDQKQVQNKTIIIVDDVITTGATLREATAVLQRAGAHHVLWLAVAH